jgi:hypothetical protein
VGEFPDLSSYKNARRLYIANCVFPFEETTHPLSQIHTIPDWVVSISIERSVIFKLPSLPLNLTRLVVSYTTLYKLPNLPAGLAELIMDHNPNIQYLPRILPPGLEQLAVINCGVIEIPELPANLCILRWWGNPTTINPLSIQIPKKIRFLKLEK